MPTWATRIFAITLFVDDLDAAKRFYADVFEQPVHFEDANSAVFRFGDTMVNLLQVQAAPALVRPAAIADKESGCRFQLTVPVDDVDGICERIRAKGVTLLNGPMDRPWGPRTASFQDPDGHIWEIAG